jgi:membrane-associated protein
MDFRRLALYSVIGGVLWAAGVALLGYWLGQVAVVRVHVELFILGIVVLSLVPIAIEVVRNRRRSPRTACATEFHPRLTSAAHRLARR